MRLLCTAWLVLAVAFAPSAAAPPTPVPGHLLIVPGQSVGSIRLGMEKGLILKSWGDPDRVVPESLGEQYVYLRFNMTIGFLADKVNGIRTWHPSMRTKEILGVKTKRADVHAAYGKPQQVEDYSDWYYTKGISFQYEFYLGKSLDKPTTVTHVQIFGPR